jgi:flagellar protein FliS
MPSIVQPPISAQLPVAARSAESAVVPYSWELMLLDSIEERVARGRNALASGVGSEKHRLLSTAVQIVGELRSTLNVGGGEPLAASLSDLCDYICRQLLIANLQNRIAILDEVSHLLRETRIAWTVLPPQARAAQVALNSVPCCGQ